MVTRWIRLGRAARMLGVSAQTLSRAGRSGRLRFGRDRRGWRYGRQSELWRARVLTLGRLARLGGVPYVTLLHHAKRHRLLCWRVGTRGRRRVALSQACVALGPRFRKRLLRTLNRNFRSCG